jgi:phosphate transport system protein
MRETFHDELNQLGESLVEMTGLVSRAMQDATSALLDVDLSLAEGVITNDGHIDAVRDDTELKAFDLLARQQPVARDLRTIVTTLRMVADLERMGDLALHIAKVARMRYPAAAVPEELRPTIREMGDIAVRIADKTRDVLAGKDAELAEQIESDDDRMDLLHRQLFSMLLSDGWSHGMEPAIDITLIGRYYERYADHSVSVARQVIFLVTGEMPAAAPASTGVPETALGL